MNRRSFLGVTIGGIVAGPPLASAKPAERVARVGVLHNANAAVASPSISAFRQGLRESGWIEGHNVTLEYRWADGDMDQHARLVSELVKLEVDVIVTAGPQAIQATRQAASGIAIVAAIMPDPVAAGFAASLSRPGGNITGLANLFAELTAKQLQIFKEMMPQARRIALLCDVGMPPEIESMEQAVARTLGINPTIVRIREVAELDAAFAAATTDRVDAVQVLPSPLFDRHRARIAELAIKHHLPTVNESSLYVRDGGLMSYGPNFPDMWRRAAGYVDRILKGAKPADLPIQQPVTFELVINLKTANAIGLTVPQPILLRADAVIQ